MHACMHTYIHSYMHINKVNMHHAVCIHVCMCKVLRWISLVSKSMAACNSSGTLCQTLLLFVLVVYMFIMTLVTTQS